MRIVFRAVGALTIFALGAGLLVPRLAMADPAGDASVGDNEQAPLQPVPDMASQSEFDCPDAGACPQCRGRRVNRRAEVGNFNCSCRGSYKYPVFPQYTYFWPGMYSQQTMTEYNSPYRFPPLKLPPPEYLRPEAKEKPETPRAQDGTSVPQAPDAQSESAPSQERTTQSVSQRIKRRYCID